MTSPVHRLFLSSVLLSIGCAAPVGGSDDPGSFLADGGVGSDEDPSMGYGAADDGSEHATASSTASAIAPVSAIPGEEPAIDGTRSIAVTAGVPRYFRVNVEPGELVTAIVRVDTSAWFTNLAALRWDGERATELWETQAYIPGVAPLSVLDPSQPRTYWFRVRADWSVNATIEITRRRFADGARCTSGCSDLLQMPVPNDPWEDGYSFDEIESVPRYLFGRRDVLMFLRHTGREMRLAGHGPFAVSDLSQWNGQTPGTDVGSPRHASHQRGKDVDLTVYATDGTAPWRTYCRTTSDGSACVPGTVTGFDAYSNAHLLASLYGSGRVTRMFLDDQLIREVRGAVEADGRIPSSVRRYFYDGVHLQHWPYHHDHVHVRFAE